MLKPNSAILGVKERFHGYLADLIQHGSNKFGFDYEIRLSRDGVLGDFISKSDTNFDVSGEEAMWNGVYGEVIRGEADVGAVAWIAKQQVIGHVVFSHPFLKFRSVFLLNHYGNQTKNRFLSTKTPQKIQRDELKKIMQSLLPFDEKNHVTRFKNDQKTLNNLLKLKQDILLVEESAAYYDIYIKGTSGFHSLFNNNDYQNFNNNIESLNNNRKLLPSTFSSISSSSSSSSFSFPFSPPTFLSEPLHHLSSLFSNSSNESISNQNKNINNNNIYNSIIDKIKNKIKPENIIRSIAEGVDMVTRNKNLVLILDRPKALYIAKQHNCNIKVSEEILNVHEYGFVLRSPPEEGRIKNKKKKVEDEHLEKLLNKMIKSFEGSGLLKKLRKKWFTEDCTLKFHQRKEKTKIKEEEIEANKNNRKKKNYKKNKIKDSFLNKASFQFPSSLSHLILLSPLIYLNIYQ